MPLLFRQQNGVHKACKVAIECLERMNSTQNFAQSNNTQNIQHLGHKYWIWDTIWVSLSKKCLGLALALAMLFPSSCFVANFFFYSNFSLLFNLWVKAGSWQL